MLSFEVQRNYLAQFFDACWVLRAAVDHVAVRVHGAEPAAADARSLSRAGRRLPQPALAGSVRLRGAAGGERALSGIAGGRRRYIERQGTARGASIEGALLRWMPRLLAALVPLGAAFGLYTTIKEARTTASLVKSVADKQSWPELNDVYRLIDVSPARLWIATLICIGLVASCCSPPSSARAARAGSTRARAAG